MSDAASPSSLAVPAARRQVLRGIGSMLLGGACFAVMDALVKYLAVRYSIVQLIFFRSLFAFLPIGTLMLRHGGIGTLRTRRLGGHLARSLTGLFSLGCFVYAFGHMPLADAIGIGFSAPLFITALSVPMLGEQVGIRRWSAVLVGFVGVLVMVRPGSGIFQTTAAVALVATLLYAIAMIFIRRLGRSESTVAITFYYSLTCVVLAGLALPFAWTTPDGVDALLLVATGIIGGCGQVLVTAAFRAAPAAVIAPFDYVTILYATALGYAVWGEVPDAALAVGALILVASGLYILHREARRGGSL